MKSVRIIPAALIGTLLALNWYSAQRTIDIAPIAPSDASADVAAQTAASNVDASGRGTAIAANSEANDLAFQERPLFSPSRRPREPQRAVAAEPEAPESDALARSTTAAESSGLRLIGVMQIGSTQRRALIRGADAPNGVWLAPGGEINGWHVSTIDTETAVVAKSGGSEQLILQRRAAGDAR